MKNAKFVVVLFALMLLAAACGGQSAEEELLEQILESGGEDIGDIDINTDDGDFSLNVQGEDGEDISITGGGDNDAFQITVEGEDGETFSIGGGEIPDGLEVPIPDGGDITSSLSGGGDMIVALSYPRTQFEQLISFYDAELDASSEEVERFETSFQTSDDVTIRSVSWTHDSIGWFVSVSDCMGMTTGEQDSVCVTVSQTES